MAPCDTSGSGAELPSDPNNLLVTHGPLPESTSLFMGFVFMLTASSDNDRKSNQTTSDGEEGEKRGFSSQLELYLLFQAIKFFRLSGFLLAVRIRANSSI